MTAGDPRTCPCLKCREHRTRQHAARLYEAGHSIWRIARQLGWPYTTTWRRLQEAGVTMRPQGPRY